MKASNKSPEMEASLTKMFGFDRTARISANLCVPAPIGCGKPITEFRDERSEREYSISGLCQDCQDKFFGT